MSTNPRIFIESALIHDLICCSPLIASIDRFESTTSDQNKFMTAKLDGRGLVATIGHAVATVVLLYTVPGPNMRFWPLQ
jgi:hypothetical protein